MTQLYLGRYGIMWHCHDIGRSICVEIMTFFNELDALDFWNIHQARRCGSTPPEIYRDCDMVVAYILVCGDKHFKSASTLVREIDLPPCFRIEIQYRVHVTISTEIYTRLDDVVVPPRNRMDTNGIYRIILSQIKRTVYGNCFDSTIEIKSRLQMPSFNAHIDII